MTVRQLIRSTAVAVGAASVVVMLAVAAPASAATTTAWAGWSPLVGTGGNYTTSLTFGTAPGLTAAVTTNSRAGQVGVISGSSTWLSEGTPIGAKYGSSRDQPYLNLRPVSDAGRIPSVTTYTFDSPTPASGWAFALGDIDADMVRVSAVTAAGIPATVAQLGYRSGFNYCAPGVAGKPSCTGDPLDIPSWDAATATLTGNVAAADTAGAAGWFEPTAALSSLTFTFTARSGLPIYQTWFASIARDIGGIVTGADGLPAAGLTLQLFDTNGAPTATATTDAAGAYSFPGYTAADGYSVELAVPVGQSVVGQNPLAADISQADALALDFVLRDIEGAPVSGQVLDTDGAPLADVDITLVDDDGSDTVTTTDPAGAFEFPVVPAGDYSLVAETPTGYSPRDAPDPFGIPEDSEVPVTGLDFTFAELSSISGTVTDGGDPLPGALVDVDGPDGASTTTTEADGTYALTGLEPGDYEISTAVPAGSDPLGETTIEIAIRDDGTDVTGVDFAFVPEVVDELSSISGRVTDGGDPLAGALVDVNGPDGVSTTTAHADGTFSLTDLEPGAYEISATTPAESYPLGDTTIQIDIPDDGSDVTGIDFDFARFGSISGRVADPDGSPLAAVPVDVSGPTGSRSFATAIDGTFSIGGLVAGDYVVTLTAPDGYVAVSPAVTEVTVTIAGGAAEIGGFELRLADEPVPPGPLPSVPTVPVDPAVPGDSTDPAVPGDPADPAVPGDPADPVDPAATPGGQAADAQEQLSATGGVVSPTLLAGGAACLLLGAFAVGIARRRRSRI